MNDKIEFTTEELKKIISEDSEYDKHFITGRVKINETDSDDEDEDD